ncbi:hypothetical protein [Clostridium taeniosporum]|uniref:Carboxypeptidase regulatory-like domain-containing protein n=1 Tax=Clostridium taeniosporum TaxID=394958 RepID=A0A1D7XJA6_9CLOT|nr:hypothetical protein [Clostridium taeniosporum]AOR23412.1 hypothetical protein BGI42_06530 [Clostridium taeniosporum]
MQNEKKKSIILYGSNLKCSKMCKVDIVVNNKRTTIIKGNVYNTDHSPLVGAAIEVKEINCETNRFKILGYCFTDYRGEYAFSLNPSWEMRYEILIYSPLIKF